MASANDPRNINDPNYANISEPAYSTRNPQVRVNDERSYGGLIIGALVAAVVILGIIFLLPMSNSNTANNNNGATASSPVRPAPATTTGSGATTPAPAVPTPAPATNR